MRIFGNASIERLDASDSGGSPSHGKSRKKLFEYISSKMTKNKIQYQSNLKHLKCGLLFFLILSVAKLLWLTLSKSKITPFICDDMEKLFAWSIAESSISIVSVISGILTMKFNYVFMYNQFLAFLVINLAFKIFLTSYILSFPSLYVNLCLQINKEGSYPSLIADGIIFLYCLYNGVALRKILTENKLYAQTFNVPLMQNSQLELLELK